MKFVVMAGGLGTKLWPVSTESEPKQFQKIVGEKSLYQMNVEGLLERYSPEDVFVSIIPNCVKFIREQTPQIPEENYIIEPMFKGTGPASGFAMLKVAERYPDEVVMFYVQSVVVRTPNDKYLEMIEGEERLVKDTGLLTTGVKFPEYVETGSDLIELGDRIEAGNNLKCYRVEGWVDVVNERMSHDTIAELLSTEKYVLHCNHYTWRPKEFFAAFKEYKPDWYEILMKIKFALGEENASELICDLYSRFETGRVEVVTQPLFNDKKVNVVVLPFDWFHITTWRDVEEYSKSRRINQSKGELVEHDSKNNFVFTKDKKIVGLVGVDDLIVIDSGKALLIASKKEISKVKDLHDEIKKKFAGYL